MKIMKKYRPLFAVSTMLLAVLLAGFQTARAQEHKTPFKNDSNHRVEIMLAQSDIKVEGYEGSDVVIRAADYREIPDRAKGLKPLYQSAVDNTGLGLSVEKEGNTLKIRKASREDNEYTIRVPNKVALIIQQVNWMGADIRLSNLAGEIEVRTNNADMEFDNVTGPVVASGTSSDVTVKYTKLNQQKPSSFTMVSGFVDLSLPANSKANLNMKSVSGEIYTDFDIEMKSNQPQSDLMRIGGNKILGRINGGGVDININTVSGDIYIRKGK